MPPEYPMLEVGWLHSGLPRAFSMDKSRCGRERARRFRERCRKGEFDSPTCAQEPEFVQANLIGIPKDYAFDFLRFALTNSRACPLLDIVSGRESPSIAAGADLSTDLPLYRVFRHGTFVEETKDASRFVENNLIFFLVGCSFTWEHMLHEKVGVRHIEEAKNVPMFNTNIPNEHIGEFGGNLVVTMRPCKPENLKYCIDTTSEYPGAHGGPVHSGNPSAIGIDDLEKPDYGDRVTIHDGEVPVFWPCGVTLLEASTSCKSLPLAITHSPGHMFITDIFVDELRGG
ncbi:hypothetical protein NDN08_000691 [Rhodosorus marinus]|uniref:DUF1445 domain-containing protein n=1 Tax=Rhodosorus marinus TaxID=101924 RepID=A0AAV8UQ86_9RHOD|nr:hypothetical protein NDN08_000691 [Rhodosorus marinus]